MSPRLRRLGRQGRGTVDHFGIHGRVDIQVGTLSKAIALSVDTSVALAI